MNATAPETIRFKKKTEKKSLNKRTVEAMEPPPLVNGRTSQRWIYDTNTPRLAICVWSTGAKTWYWIGRVDEGTRMIRTKLGEYPEMTPEQARKRAAATSADVAKGIDPQKEKKTVRGELTLQQAFDIYLVGHAKKYKRTWKEDEDQFSRYCGSLKNRRLSSIDAGQVADLHTQIGEDHGKYVANRLLAMLSKLFNFAKGPASRIGYKKENPCKGIQKFKEESRERFMDAAELERFFQSLEQESQLNQDFFNILLLTGGRRRNVQSMRWDELHLEKAQWHIPGEKFKNGKAQIVHLVAEALAILKRRQAENQGSEWVFPSVRHGRTGQLGHIDSPKFAWSRICKRAGLHDLRMHDLRRTLGSWQAATGASLPIIGKTLGHLNQSTTAIYARLNIDPVRQAVDTAVAAMMGAAKKSEDANGTK